MAFCKRKKRLQYLFKALIMLFHVHKCLLWLKPVYSFTSVPVTEYNQALIHLDSWSSDAKYSFLLFFFEVSYLGSMYSQRIVMSQKQAWTCMSTSTIALAMMMKFTSLLPEWTIKFVTTQTHLQRASTWPHSCML